jgi:hypothetical protein
VWQQQKKPAIAARNLSDFENQPSQVRKPQALAETVASIFN